MATLIARISENKLYQYDEYNHTVIYENNDSKLYDTLSEKDNCVFICPGFVLFGKYQEEKHSHSVQFGDIKRLNITNSDLLRLSAFNPEENCRTKGSFYGYIQIKHINTDDLAGQFETKKFIAFNVVKVEQVKHFLSTLNENDRVVTIDTNNQIKELHIIENGSLKPTNWGDGYFNSKGRTLDELIRLINNLKESKPNHIRSIYRIKNALESGDIHVFRGFSDYYNIIHNKSLYSNNQHNNNVVNTEDDVQQNNVQNQSFNMSLNTIYFGPPGTGKTYQLIESALIIINDEVYSDRVNNKIEFDKLQKDGRIYFTTFHQNMSYEDFIEGIKPVEPKDGDQHLRYEIQDGLFMKACIEATYNYIKSNFPNDKLENRVRDFNQVYDDLFQKVENAEVLTLETLTGSVNVSVNENGNFNITHLNGNRSYVVSRDRLFQLFDAFENLDNVRNIVNEFRSVIGGCNATAFWAVLNKIHKMIADSQQNAVNPAEIDIDKSVIVKSFWEKAEYTRVTEDKSDPYVFIIDEINRGNIAQIFGELITLIEEGKRMGNKEELRVLLPYSKRRFCIPPNLYIIGTMNTADRSVEALDTALRRRFSFIHKTPDSKELKDHVCEGVNLASLLEAINNRLIVLKDKDHTIGHAWFWDVRSINELRIVFRDKIIPLLQEYFYNDYEKLGLVLGNRFVEEEPSVNSNIFASFSPADSLRNQYYNKKVYRITDAHNWDKKAFESIYGPQSR